MGMINRVLRSKSCYNVEQKVYEKDESVLRQLKWAAARKIKYDPKMYTLIAYRSFNKNLFDHGLCYFGMRETLLADIETERAIRDSMKEEL